MKKLSLIISIASFLLISCGSEPREAYKPRVKTEAELKAELYSKECARAPQLIDGKLGYKPIFKNLLSIKVKGLNLSCSMKNNSAIATFKDIKARATFLSKTGATILTKDFDVYEFIGPNQTIKYNTEISISNQQYKDINSFNWKILSASCK